MRKKQVWRYYCDFCKKSGCSGGHLKRHEERCTANPNRYCGMCDNKPNMKELIEALGVGDAEGVDNLRGAAEGCPACILSAIRQSGLQTKDIVDGDSLVQGNRIEFNYEEEKNSWWAEKNAEEAERYSPY